MDFVKNRCYSCCAVLQACPVCSDSPVAECCLSAAVGSACRRAGYWQLWGVAGTVSRCRGLLRACRLQQKRSWLKRSTWPRDSMCTLRRWLHSRCTVAIAAHHLQAMASNVFAHLQQCGAIVTIPALAVDTAATPACTMFRFTFAVDCSSSPERNLSAYWPHFPDTSSASVMIEIRLPSAQQSQTSLAKTSLPRAMPPSALLHAGTPASGCSLRARC